MKVKSLKIKNFRCFEELKIDFNEDYTVLVGVNGAGKSSILEAISIGLGSYIAEFSNISGNSIHNEDAHYKYYEVGSRIDPQQQFPVSIEMGANIDGDNVFWVRSLNRQGGNTTVSGTKQIKNYALQLNEELMHGNQNIILPIVSYYGTARLWMQKKQKKNKDTAIRLARQNGYIDCLSAAANEKLMLKWFEEMTYLQLQEGSKIAELEAVKDALKRCYQSIGLDLEDVEFRFNVKTKDLEIYMERKDGSREILPTRLLSDGIKGILGVVADIAYRMALLNPQLLEKVNETPGIILIDEIDMHLHPAWQKKIIHDLREIFPNVQFLFTTHSPSVLSHVPRENILMLNNHQVYPPMNKTYGRDVDSILREIMLVESRPDEILDKLKSFSDYIEESKLEDARKILNELEDILGSNDEEVISSKITLELEEM